MFNDECIAETKEWVLSNENPVSENEGAGDLKHENVDINPNNSVSTGGKYSNKTITSNKSSTTSSAQIKAAAERAALVARIAALNEQHALEEQKQQIQRRKEQLNLETELAASTAQLAVFQTADEHSSFQTQMDGMNSYFEREKRKLVQLLTLDPVAKEYEPVAWKASQQNVWSLPQSKQPAMGIKPNQTER